MSRRWGATAKGRVVYVHPGALEDKPWPRTKGQVTYVVAVTVFALGCLLFGPW